MDRSIQMLRTLAIITLVLCVATILYQMSLLSSASSAFSVELGFSSVFNDFVWATCVALGIAAGVAAIVIATQHHQRRWLTGLLIATAITPYGPIVAVLMTPRIMYNSFGIYNYLRLVTLSYTVLPFVTALVVLAYCLRSHHQTNTPPPSEESNLEIEYSSLE